MKKQVLSSFFGTIFYTVTTSAVLLIKYLCSNFSLYFCSWVGVECSSY